MISKKVTNILNALDEEYGTEFKCYLTHDSAWQLLIATILSAQCTDARVNIVTEELFKKYPGVKYLAEANLEELEKDIKPAGFQHSKAKNIIACCQKLMTDFGGEVPRGIDELTSLPGVGRKTANVIRGNIYKDPSIVVDTHVKRITKLLGLTKEDDPVKIEYELMKKLPEDHWIIYNIHIIRLGRTICIANRPKCNECMLKDFCDYGKTKK